MTDTEREVLQTLATLATNQQVTNTHVEYIRKKVDAVEKRMEEKQKKDEIVEKKVIELDERTKCLPEMKKEFTDIAADSKKKWKLSYILLGAIVGFSVLTITVSQSCSVENISANSSIKTEVED